jgi:hypothetical protein
LPDDLEPDRTVELEPLRLLVDLTEEPEERLFEEVRTVDLFTCELTVFDIVFLMRLDIFEPRLRVSG